MAVTWHRACYRSVVAFAAVIGLGVGNTTEAAENACNQYSVSITTERMRSADVQQFDAAFHNALAKVCNWWGPSFNGRMTVLVEDSNGPDTSLAPAWRGNHGFIKFRTKRVLSGRSPIVHQLIHVFAPNGNRFLAEGLAVYAEEYLTNQIAFPTFGKDLHQAAKAFAATTDLKGLEAIATPYRLKIYGKNEQPEGYTVAGSFVRYLIESEGMEKFQTLYAKTPMVPGKHMESDPNRWQEVYGVPLDILTERWRQYIADL